MQKGALLAGIVFFEQKKYNNKVDGTSMDYMTLKEASEKWGILSRQINYYCAAGRIPGAVKMATILLIPKTAENRLTDKQRKERRLQNERI